METEDKRQIMLFRDNASEHLEDFVQDIECSPVNTYEDLCEARIAIDESIDLLLKKYVED